MSNFEFPYFHSYPPYYTYETSQLLKQMEISTAAHRLIASAVTQVAACERDKGEADCPVV